MGIDNAKELHDALSQCDKTLTACQSGMDEHRLGRAASALRAVAKALKGERYPEAAYWLGWFEGLMSSYAGSGRQARFAKLFSSLKPEPDTRITVVMVVAYLCENCDDLIVYFDRVTLVPPTLLVSDEVVGLLADNDLSRLTGLGLDVPSDVDGTETDLISGNVTVHFSPKRLPQTLNEESLALLVGVFKQNGWSLIPDFADYLSRWREHRHKRGEANHGK